MLLATFLQRVGSLFSLDGNNSLIALMQDGIPSVVNMKVDVKKDLELRLRCMRSVYTFGYTNWCWTVIRYFTITDGKNTPKEHPIVEFSAMKSAWEEASNSNVESFSFNGQIAFISSERLDRSNTVEAQLEYKACVARSKSVQFSGKYSEEEFERCEAVHRTNYACFSKFEA